MLDKIKLLLNITNDDKDDLLLTLIGICKDMAIDYCNLEEYDSKLDSAVIEMVIQRYNGMGSEGLGSATFSGIKEEYNSGWGIQILQKLRKHRKVKCV